MKITFILNSLIRKVDDFVTELYDHDHPWIRKATVFPTKHKGHAIELASRESDAADLLVAVGGDGTLNEVVNGIFQADIGVDQRPALALIPRGSANDFARMQQIPKGLDDLAEAIEKDEFHTVDVGRISMDSGDLTHYFINVADSGIGAEVVKRLEEKSIFRKIISSDLRFALAIFRTFLSYKRKKVEIFLDNRDALNGRILTLVVANSSAFGSGLIIAPDARINSGTFELLVGDISLLDYLLNIRRLLKGKKLKSKGVKYSTASHIRISGPDNLYTQADGELVGKGDVEIECLPGAIRFLLPDFAY